MMSSRIRSLTSLLCSLFMNFTSLFSFFFFFNDTATTEIYTLSLHDALPISRFEIAGQGDIDVPVERRERHRFVAPNLIHGDRKSTRLNSSHSQISYAVFCLKKKKKKKTNY